MIGLVSPDLEIVWLWAFFTTLLLFLLLWTLQCPALDRLFRSHRIVHLLSDPCRRNCCSIFVSSRRSTSVIKLWAHLPKFLVRLYLSDKLRPAGLRVRIWRSDDHSVRPLHVTWSATHLMTWIQHSLTDVYISCWELLGLWQHVTTSPDLQSLVGTMLQCLCIYTLEADISLLP